ncbi:MAG: B12-binding domain-containing radical SAM protein [Betaproteobacteria bacterium]|nr:B12-binding domain-containing radical SAM protein [Betaproteobacteria bacterium]
MQDDNISVEPRRRDGKRITTSPWATAIPSDKKVFEPLSFPDLKGMKVMLIVPNDFYRKKLMPLGPGYIATALRRCSIDVQVLDCAIFSYDDIEIAKRVIQSGCTIFAMGALYPMIKEVERICNIIRAVLPKATIILGGSLPTPIPEFVLRRTRADIATIGEAELTIVEVMSALAGLKDLSSVKGIAYLREEQYFDNGKPILPRRVSKEEVGWPMRDLFPVEHYIRAPKFYPYGEEERLLTISTGRGCPYACDFCFRVSSYRIREFDEMFDEMEDLIARYKLDGFYIIDDLMMLSKHKVTAFCEGILNRGLKIRFNCTGRVNTVTPEIIKLLKEAGCIAIFYGIESGNDHVLKTMSKKTNLQQVYEAVRLTKEQGIYCEYGIMFGQPGEDHNSLRDTMELIKNLSYGEYRSQKIFGCVPFPGSGLYDWCKETGRIKDDQDFYDRYICQDWSLDQIPVNMTNLPDHEVNKIFREANHELSRFFMERVSQDWVRCFGGDVDSLPADSHDQMTHIMTRIESSGSTYDTSGRT